MSLLGAKRLTKPLHLSFLFGLTTLPSSLSNGCLDLENSCRTVCSRPTSTSRLVSFAENMAVLKDRVRPTRVLVALDQSSNQLDNRLTIFPLHLEKFSGRIKAVPKLGIDSLGGCFWKVYLPSLLRLRDCGAFRMRSHAQSPAGVETGEKNARVTVAIWSWAFSW